MKIAIFTDSFYPGCGGTERAVYELAIALQNLGHEVMVCAPKYRKKDNNSYPFFVLRAKSIKLTNNEYYALPGMTKEFKKALNKFSPQVIHIQSVSPMAGYAIKYAKKKNVPTLMTVHTRFKIIFKQTLKLNTIVWFLIRNMVKKLKKMDKVCTVCNAMTKDLVEYGYSGPCQVIRNGATFKSSEFGDEGFLARKTYSLHNYTNFLFVGHISKFKNLQFLIDSIKIVKDCGYYFKMIFVGKGNDDKYFKKYVKKCGLDDSVIFTGQITDMNLLSSIYSSATLYIFPSIFDNDPLTVVEAATHKIPAITLKDTGSSERIVDGFSGFIAENDKIIFAQKIIEAIKDREKLKIIGENACKNIPKDWNETAKEYLKLYEELLTNNT